MENIFFYSNISRLVAFQNNTRKVACSCALSLPFVKQLLHNPSPLVVSVEMNSVWQSDSNIFIAACGLSLWIQNLILEKSVIQIQVKYPLVIKDENETFMHP